VGQRAAHHPDVGRDGDGLEPEPLEDRGVGGVVGPVRAVEAVLVAVARVRILHDELADPDEAAARARLVAELRLEVVDDHGQLAIALHDVAQEERHDLLVGHGEDHVALGAVLEPDELGPDCVVPPALAPDLRRVDDRHLHLLRADLRQLLADHLLDALVDTEPERQERVDARPELTDVAGPKEEPVRRHLHVGRVVSEGREEELAQAHGTQG
jgi:hypothetical protein